MTHPNASARYWRCVAMERLSAGATETMVPCHGPSCGRCTSVFHQLFSRGISDLFGSLWCNGRCQHKLAWRLSWAMCNNVQIISGASEGFAAFRSHPSRWEDHLLRWYWTSWCEVQGVEYRRTADLVAMNCPRWCHLVPIRYDLRISPKRATGAQRWPCCTAKSRNHKSIFYTPFTMQTRFRDQESRVVKRYLRRCCAWSMRLDTPHVIALCESYGCFPLDNSGLPVWPHPRHSSLPNRMYNNKDNKGYSREERLISEVRPHRRCRGVFCWHALSVSNCNSY